MALLVFTCFFGFDPGALSAPNLIPNGDFESGTNDWRSWSRSAGALTVTLTGQAVHSGRSALQLQHTGEQDWSLEPFVRVSARTGDVIELDCWLRVQGQGSVTLCASTWDQQGRVVDWSAGARSVSDAQDWVHIATRIVVCDPIVQIQPRLIGAGLAQVSVDDFSAIRDPNVLLLRQADLPPVLSLTNEVLAIAFDTSNATFTVQDRRCGRTWRQKAFSSCFILRSASVNSRKLDFLLLDAASGVELAATAILDRREPELVVTLSGKGELSSSVAFPPPFTGQPGDYLVVPMNEGISYPVDDLSIPEMHLIAYGGHGICMPFFGETDGARGYVAILETPDDASIRIARHDGMLTIAPEWESQVGKFGYARRIRYIFLEQGGHVAMAKKYRNYSKKAGLLKTLAEKRDANSNVDRLIGAVNVWCWDKDSIEIVNEMQRAGIQRLLWSNRQTPDNLTALNALGVLTSRYDIYQDVMATTNFSRLRWIHPDWTTNAWPNDIILDPRGNWLKGWGVESRNGPLIPCGVLCDRFGPDFARERVPAELATHPYLCRFIDTTTAAPWNECYSPDHPMTRSESRKWKMELLRYISRDNKLVTGSETGHDAAVPFVHYFEGMMSLGPYRVPDAGRRMAEIWTNVPAQVAKFQLGHKYRLPLWELVYHDCVVAHWYWGDYNNKLPALWDKRDLFNALYGVPPMFMFDRKLWETSKDRFVRSYQNTCPLIRRVGYQEMINHQFLTADRNVQETTFANGVRVIVNFAEHEIQILNGQLLKGMSVRVVEP
ncbi:MAG TPA: glycoside hydrolase [Patescibacteria group bacterium]|nr:glycoside hydrolase [Patescibacteria group bacterium]